MVGCRHKSHQRNGIKFNRLKGKFIFAKLWFSNGQPRPLGLHRELLAKQHGGMVLMPDALAIIWLGRFSSIDAFARTLKVSLIAK